MNARRSPNRRADTRGTTKHGSDGRNTFIMLAEWIEARHDPTPAIIEAAARALANRRRATAWDTLDTERREWWRGEAQEMLDCLAPLIEAAALEEAAKVVEDEDGEYSWAGEHRNMALLQQHSLELAAAIRALKPAESSAA